MFAKQRHGYPPVEHGSRWSRHNIPGQGHQRPGREAGVRAGSGRPHRRCSLGCGPGTVDPEDARHRSTWQVRRPGRRSCPAPPRFRSRPARRRPPGTPGRFPRRRPASAAITVGFGPRGETADAPRRPGSVPRSCRDAPPSSPSRSSCCPSASRSSHCPPTIPRIPPASNSSTARRPIRRRRRDPVRLASLGELLGRDGTSR